VGSRGTIISAWSWRDHPVATMLDQDTLTMVFADGGPHVHRPEGIGWRIETGAGRLTHLAGYQPIATGPAQPRGTGAAQHRRTALVLTSVGEVAPEIGQMTAAGTPGQTIATLRFELGADHYRRSEESWREAGSPAATVVLAATDTELLVEVTVCKDSVVFAPGRSENPLDNEHPDINSDGVQLHVASVPVPKDEAGTRRQHTGTAFEPPGAPVSSWILVPEPGGSQVRVSTTSNRPQPPLSANWRRTPTGYQLLARVGLGTARTDKVIDLAVDVIVNEITPGRQRRRGQIVLSGGRGEWVYLRGDRQASSRLLPVRVRRG
jgi:hypothetical protein